MLAVLCRNWSITSTIENCVPKFREKVCRNAENCLFLKNQPVNRNVWDENEKERELQDLGIYVSSKGCPIYRKFLKILFHPSLKISRILNRNFGCT